MRDAEPEGEVAIWEDIATTIEEVEKLVTKPLGDRRTEFRKHILGHALGLSMGSYKTEQIEKDNTILTVASIFYDLRAKRKGVQEADGNA